MNPLTMVAHLAAHWECDVYPDAISFELTPLHSPAVLIMVAPDLNQEQTCTCVHMRA